MLTTGIARHRLWIAATLVGLVLLALAPLVLTPFQIRVGQIMLFSAGLSLSWTILGGFSGYWSFGHTVFIGLGAFAAALTVGGATAAAMPPAVGFALALLVGGGVCGAVALVLAYPILRLRGIYFAIAMLGVSQVFGELNNNLDVFQGSMGVVLPKVAPRGSDPATFFYYVFLAATAAILGVAFWVKIVRIGHGLTALREDEDTARMLGVPTERYKITAFVISGALTGVLGVIYAWSLGYITTGSVYRTDFSLNMIVFSLLGGMGTLVGPIVGSVVMIWLTQVLLGNLLEIHTLLTGAILVGMVLLAPRGIVGFARGLARRRSGPLP